MVPKRIALRHRSSSARHNSNHRGMTLFQSLQNSISVKEGGPRDKVDMEYSVPACFHCGKLPKLPSTCLFLMLRFLQGQKNGRDGKQGGTVWPFRGRQPRVRCVLHLKQSRSIVVTNRPGCVCMRARWWQSPLQTRVEQAKHSRNMNHEHCIS